MFVLLVSIITILVMLTGIILYPKITIKKFSISPFWVVPLIGALILFFFRGISFDEVCAGLASRASINPVKILTLFFSMTFLSIILDELGFFNFLASKALRKANKNQFSLFCILYILTSVLTIFTSNDIIILTFTPFIVFFSKRANINPIPFLVTEFVAANTWSMMFIIGNPTNIYLATKFNLSFVEYFKYMWLPTLMGGVASFIILLLVFRKDFQKEMVCEYDEVKIENKFLLIVNLVCLGMCTILLVISSYIHLEMYLISLVSASILLIIILIYSLIKRKGTIVKGLKRLPWTLIPFVISMFVIVLALKEQNVTHDIRRIMPKENAIIPYGVISFLTCNLVNNIPMSILFAEIIPSGNLGALFATIIGSNIGAFLTPIGALAGIMWLSILKRHNVNFSFLTFTKYGIILSFLALCFALLGLIIII